MLNTLFNGPLGFHHGVRVSAILISVLLLFATLLMKPRLLLAPKKDESALSELKTFSRDVPYVLTALG